MLTVITRYGKGVVGKIPTVFGPVSHVSYGRVLLNRIFQTFVESPFWETVISEIHRLWGWSFFRKCSKFDVHFENREKNWEKGFCFWDNSIWIGCIKFPLLRRECLSSAVKMLTNSLKILHSTNIDFFQLNYIQIDR